MYYTCRHLLMLLASFFMCKGVLKLFPHQPNKFKQLAVWLIIFAVSDMPSWAGDENPILLFPFFAVVFMTCLSGCMSARAVMCGIFYALLVPVGMILDTAFLTPNRYDAIISIVAKFIAWYALSVMLSRLVTPGGLRLSGRLWALLGGLTLAPLAATLSFSLWGNDFVSAEIYDMYEFLLNRLAFSILPFAFLSALALLIAAMVLSRHEALEQASRLANIQEVYYTGLKREQTGLRTLRHDLRNHIIVLQALLDQHNQEGARRYLDNLSESPALIGGKRYSDNEAANAVLTCKAAQMEEEGLVADFSAQLPESLTIPPPELCALLGNALDNAIDGAKRAAERTIRLRAFVDKGIFMLQVQNAIGGAINPDLSTTKPDDARHGMGLAGMREIAERYGGTLDTTVKDGRFELVVCFCCDERKSVISA